MSTEGLMQLSAETGLHLGQRLVPYLLSHLGAIDDHLAQGGPVMWLIAANCIVLFALLADRGWAVLAFRRRRRAHLEQLRRLGRARARSADPALVPTALGRLRMRQARFSRLGAELERGFSLIRTLIKISPLLGLLGTVTGMIVVFETLAITGTGDARALAQGISQATLPTLTGMFVALPALFVQGRVESQAKAELAWLERHAIDSGAER